MTIILLLVALVTPVQAQSKPAPAPSLTGKWTMSLEMETQTATPGLEIVQDGEKITGSYVSQRYGKAPIAGTIKGKTVQFTVTLNVEGTEIQMNFKGETAADFSAMKGQADLGGAGEANWTARKAEK